MKSLVLINGSARGDGNSQELIQTIQKIETIPVVHLYKYDISHFDYLHHNKSDDFLPLMKELIDQYSFFLLLSPVYWYAMSGHMKVFMDRWTDLLTIEKSWGRKLRGKEMAVLTSSHGNHLEDRFWLPFKYSANYLGMTFKGGLHTIPDELDLQRISQFLTMIKKSIH
jgi:multimeric flavodoxin WrbA